MTSKDTFFFTFSCFSCIAHAWKSFPANLAEICEFRHLDYRYGAYFNLREDSYFLKQMIEILDFTCQMASHKSGVLNAYKVALSSVRYFALN